MKKSNIIKGSSIKLLALREEDSFESGPALLVNKKHMQEQTPIVNKSKVQYISNPSIESRELNIITMNSSDEDEAKALPHTERATPKVPHTPSLSPEQTPT